MTVIQIRVHYSVRGRIVVPSGAAREDSNVKTLSMGKNSPAADVSD